MSRAERIQQLHAAARERILVLDGSWGVMFQARGLAEADYRGERFAGHNGQMKGNNDILCLTRPDIVAELHDAYFAAGADISETNTFSATTIAQDDYKLDDQAVWDINLEGAKLARAAADRWTEKEPHKPRFAAGSIGPLNKMLSMSSDVNDPGARLVTFDQVYEAYRQQVRQPGEVSKEMFAPSLPAFVAEPNDDQERIAEHNRSVATAEKSFSDRAQIVGLKQAFGEFGRPDAMNMYGGAGFAYGLDAVVAGFKEEGPAKLHWSTERSFAASSGDLAVSIGTIKPNDPKDGAGFPFFTVWRRDGPDKPWRYVAE